MEPSVLEEPFHLGHSPEKWQPAPADDHYQRVMAWLRLFWTCWPQMEPHVPAILERHPEMCECDSSCMRHMGHPWGPLSLSPLLVGWTSPESPWLRRGEDGRVLHLFYALVGQAPCCGSSLEVEMETGRTCLRRPVGSQAYLPEHLRVPFHPISEPWLSRNMSLMELIGHFLPHPPVVVQALPDGDRPDEALPLAELLPVVPGVLTGDPARVEAHLATSLEFRNAARLLTLHSVGREGEPDVCLAFNPAHIAPGLDDMLRARCAELGLSFAVKAMFSGVPRVYRGDTRVQSVHLYIRQDLCLDETTQAKRPEGFRRLQSLVLDCAKYLHTQA